MQRLLMILLPLALAACVSTPPTTTDAGQAADNKGTLCDREARTGSMLPSTRCTTAAEREAEKRGAQAVSEAVRQQRSAQTKGGT